MNTGIDERRIILSRWCSRTKLLSVPPRRREDTKSDNVVEHTFKQISNDWLETYVSTLSEATQQRYNGLLKHYIIPHIGKTPLWTK